MKTVFITIFFVTFCLNNIFSQDNAPVYINESFNNHRLIDVLNILENKYGIKLAFDNSLVADKKISCKIRGRNPEQALNLIFAQTDIDYIKSNDVFLLIKSKTEIIKISDQEKEKSKNLTGIVKDAVSGETLPYTSLEFGVPRKNIYANSDGFFSINGTTQDTLFIVARFIGYTTAVFKFAREDRDKFVTLNLFRSDEKLDEIVVIEQSERIIEIKTEKQNKTTLNPHFFRTIPSLGEADAFRALQLLPGVSGATESAADLRVQGDPADRNLVLFDGFTVYHLDHFYGTFTAFNSNAVKNIDFYKAGFGAEYGGRVSSVIDITGKTGNFKKFAGNANLNLLSSSATLEIPLIKDKLTFFSAGRRSYSDILKTYLFKDLFSGLQSNSAADLEGNDYYFLDDNNKTSFVFYDYNAKLTYMPDTKNIFSLSFYKSSDRFQNSFSRQSSFDSIQYTVDKTNNEKTSWGNTGIGGQFSHKWNKDLYTKFNVSYSKYFSDFQNSWSYDYAIEDSAFNYRYVEVQQNSVSDFGFAANIEYAPNSGTELKTGFRQSFFELTNTETATGTIETPENQSARISELYLTGTRKFLKIARISAGGRLIKNNLSNSFDAEPRLSLSCEFSEHYTSTCSFGKYHQYIKQTFFDNIMFGSHDFWLLSDNKTIPVLQSTHYTWTNIYRLKNYTISVDMYRKESQGLSVFGQVYENLVSDYKTDSLDAGNDTVYNGTEIQTVDSISKNMYYFSGESIVNGIDFLAAKNTGRWTAWLGFSIYNRRMNYESFYSIFDSDMNSELNFEIKTLNRLKFGKWTASATWIYNRSMLTSVDPYLYTFIVSDGKSSEIIVNTPDQAKKTLTYHRLDISITRLFEFKNTRLSCGFSVLNLYNKKNIKQTRFYLSYWDESTQIVTEKPILTANAVKLIGITPVVYLFFEF